MQANGTSSCEWGCPHCKQSNINHQGKNIQIWNVEAQFTQDAGHDAQHNTSKWDLFTVNMNRGVHTAHIMQATSKEKHSNLCMHCVPCPVWMGPKVMSSSYKINFMRMVKIDLYLNAKTWWLSNRNRKLDSHYLVFQNKVWTVELELWTLNMWN